MFKKLIASAPDHRRWFRNPAVILVSVAVHVLVLAGIVWASTRPEEAAAPEPERLTYIDITEIPPPEPDPDEIFEAPPEPAEPPPVQQPTSPAPRTATPPSPAPPQRAPATPRNPVPSPAATEQPAGFQELQVPDVDVAGIPRPDVSAPAVRAEDFGGRGTPGGTASGTPAPPVPAAARRGTGTGEGSGSGARGEPGGEGSGTYSVNLVDEPAELVNRAQVAQVLARRYPKALQDAGVEGRVVVQFVVDQNGRVEAGSVKVISASQQDFAEPTRAAVNEFRFRPAKRQGRTVRQIVQIPVTWQIDR